MTNDEIMLRDNIRYRATVLESLARERELVTSFVTALGTRTCKAHNEMESWMRAYLIHRELCCKPERDKIEKGVEAFVNDVVIQDVRHFVRLLISFIDLQRGAESHGIFVRVGIVTVPKVLFTFDYVGWK